MVRKRGVLRTIITVFLFGLVRSAYANPIIVTGDAVTWWDSSSGSFDMAGNELQIQSGGPVGTANHMVNGFAGQTAFLGGGIFGNIFWQGFAQIDGTRYSIPGMPSIGTAVWRDDLVFTAEPVVLPTVPDGIVSISA